MSDFELHYSSIAQVGQQVRTGQASIYEVTEVILDRLDRLEPSLNAYITVLRAEALASAAQRQKELDRGDDRGPLHGVPISIKDNFETAGVRTTAGSPTLQDWIPTRDATAVSALLENGAIIVGKTNLQQFAYGAPHERFGEPRNPHALERTCGGSSSGSCAATAAGIGFGSVGSDTGGSIRIPAAFCGVVGLKPTYGLVSRSGVIPVSPNLDHVGPIARSVEDCALLLDALVPGAARLNADSYAARLGDGISGTRLGVMRPQERSLIRSDVHSVFDLACAAFEAEGAELVDVSIPVLHTAQLLMWIITGVEAADYHGAALQDDPANYSEIFRTRLELAGVIPAVDYVRAQRVREQFKRSLDDVLTTVDAVLLPTVGVPAWPRGTQRVAVNGTEEDAPNVGSRLTALCNATGHPAITVPCGVVEQLPVGLQVVGRWWSEAAILRIAAAYESATDWHERRPAAVASGVLGA
jgi:aspartyl-tRNA(Asn)/glutamyl-tRNA(Gln) amidotransferase subunit A